MAIKPPALQSGDTVGIVTPATPSSVSLIAHFQPLGSLLIINLPNVYNHVAFFMALLHVAVSLRRLLQPITAVDDRAQLAGLDHIFRAFLHCFADHLLAARKVDP